MEKSAAIQVLQEEILKMQGFKPAHTHALDLGLGPMRDSFPSRSFPLGAVHEFLTGGSEETAATTGFVSGLISTLMKGGGTALWVSKGRTLYPPALKRFGIRPDHILFIDLTNEREVFWVVDEALKCGALSAVVGEIRDLSFTESRRLQLAVEESKVTGFLLRKPGVAVSTTACVSRWRIASLPSELGDGLPGVGFPRWRVELLRIRNGRPGSWDVQWANGGFEFLNEKTRERLLEQTRKAG